jgi:hypothetical protein
MRFFDRHVALRRSLASFLAAVLASGCMTWRPALSRSDSLLAQKPAELRLHLSEGRQVDLHAPTLEGGYVLGYRQWGDARRVAIPAYVVKSTQQRVFDPAGTIALAAAATVTGILFVAASQASRAPGLKVRVW